MEPLSRRGLLRVSGLTLTSSVAGCVTDAGGTDVETPTDTPDESNEGAGLTGWERSTDCITTGERDDTDSHYDSVIKVESVTKSLGDGYSPIDFADLTSGEQDILRTVTEEGGYGTCDTSRAFDRFVDRVREHKSRQEESTVYLERERTYYGLYVEVTDQGISY